MTARKARLLCTIPSERILPACGDGSTPQIGDIVELDQGFTFPDGRPGGMVYCMSADGGIRWGADVNDFELDVLPGH
jgi:hypothetical protein